MCIEALRATGSASISNYSAQVRGPYTFDVQPGSNKFLFDDCYDWPLILQNYVAVIGPSSVSSGPPPIALGCDLDGDILFQDNGDGTILLNALEVPPSQKRVLYLQLIVYYIPTGNSIFSKLLPKILFFFSRFNSLFLF